MRNSTISIACLFAVIWLSQAGAQQATAARVTLFEGARLITGDGSAPIENSAFLVENARFTRVGRRGEMQPPAGAARVDLDRQDRDSGARRRPLAHRLHEEPDERGDELHPREHPRSHVPVRVLRRCGEPGDGHRLRRDAVSAARRDPRRQVPGRGAVPDGRPRAGAARSRSAPTTCGRRHFRSPPPEGARASVQELVPRKVSIDQDVGGRSRRHDQEAGARALQGHHRRGAQEQPARRRPRDRPARTPRICCAPASTSSRT